MRTLLGAGHEVCAVDVQGSSFTTDQGSIVDRAFVSHCMQGVQAVVHTATLHKPHVATHSRQAFIDTNITGTLNLLEEAVTAGVQSFVFTSTTSVFGDALIPPSDEPAVWVTEELVPIPKNIYGVTKMAAENLCQLYYRNQGLPCLILRTSRFFPEEDDSRKIRESYTDQNAKVCEFLFRRVDIADAVDAHLLAIKKAPDIGFDRYIISATSPFRKSDLLELRNNAAHLLQRLLPDYQAEFNRRGWQMFPDIDRVYVNAKARRELGWLPRYDFPFLLGKLQQNKQPMSKLSTMIGSRGYHEQSFDQGPYPVED